MDGGMTILLSAYACEPGKGSEPGIGWHWATRLARAGHRVWVLTRENNRGAIERALAQAPVENLRFAYCDLPRWARWWKRGGRGVRLYYLLWQGAAFLLARRLCREVRFDVVHHITFGVYRHPSFMAFLGVPFVFGPLGGGERAPLALRRSFPLRGFAADLLRDGANLLARVDPLLNAAYARSAAILCKTRETLHCIPDRHRGRCMLGVELGAADEREEDAPPAREPGAGLRVLYVGRLVYWKGMHLGVEAFARLLAKHPHARLTVIGGGPEDWALRALALRLGVSHAVRWTGWRERDEVLRAYREHDVFLFPSVHDSSGNAVLEAMSSGLPVVCLDTGGPAMLVGAGCGLRVPARGRAETVAALAEALGRFADRPSLAQRMGRAARRRARLRFSWERQVARMERLYRSVAARGAPALVALLAFALHAGAAERYVAPGNPSARDAGDGTKARPYRSLGYAMRRLRPGDTLNLESGTYRAAIRFPDHGWPQNAPRTVIQSAPGGALALIKGSDPVTGWNKAGPGLFVKEGWSVQSEQVFVDGKPLAQIGGTVFGGYPGKPGHRLARVLESTGGIWPGRRPGGVGQMTPGSFHYDARAKRLYVKVALPSLEGHRVEASVRPYLVFGQKLSNVTLRRLRFRHANTTAVAQTGAVTLGGSGLRLERLDIREVDGAGMDVAGDDVVIRDSRADYCGQVGIKLRGRHNRLIDNEMSFNNTRGFNKWWEAGGAKFVGDGGLRDSEVSGNVAVGNHGDGIWFDWMNDHNLVHHNLAAFNEGFGIHYEASQRGYIYDNTVAGNRQRGIYLMDSSHSVVAHNLVAGNGMEGIAIVQDGRAAKKRALVARDNVVFGNVVAWSGKAAIVLPAAGAGNASDYNLFIGDAAPPRFSLGWGSRESPVRQGLAAWQRAARQDLHSWYEKRARPDDLKSWSARDYGARGLVAQPVAASNADLPPALRAPARPGPRP